MEAKTTEDFFRHTADPNSAVAVHFWASWAPQCIQMNEVFDELAKLHPFVTFLKVEAEELPELSEKYDIAAVPTFVLLKGGAVVDRVNGANAAELSKKVNVLAQSLTTTITAKPIPQPHQQQHQQHLAQQSTSEGSSADLRVRLKQLISAAPVMVFIKGNPKNPKCGFSRKIVDVLNEQNVEFSSFDILEDETVRQGLKEYSNWPTFPQLYINGELIGGLDIVKEMAENGELASILPKPSTKEALHKKLHDLTCRAKIMVFIKGTPENPRCGFSKQILEILHSHSVVFDYFDILGDSEVREGLKEYSNWPTFPQLYINGELIGGLDIVKEMVASGDFPPPATA